MTKLSLASRHRGRVAIAAALFAIPGLINLYPLVGVLGAKQLESLYGVDVAAPDLALLLRHRAVLFGLLGALLLAATSVYGRISASNRSAHTARPWSASRGPTCSPRCSSLAAHCLPGRPARPDFQPSATFGTTICAPGRSSPRSTSGLYCCSSQVGTPL